ncbi:hypothetical protein EJ08DRAFT_683761 [Tothia fuscella]|uniref:Uncharacterized protein n=1 Tax=Tothia fuscella TaxID=1048955 RepID=A0A9P4NFD1_9PEZI|nr:hypothetical protein EJ08DRAFT_683761 [Tothia fuscella]
MDTDNSHNQHEEEEAQNQSEEQKEPRRQESHERKYIDIPMETQQPPKRRTLAQFNAGIEMYGYYGPVETWPEEVCARMVVLCRNGRHEIEMGQKECRGCLAKGLPYRQDDKDGEEEKEEEDKATPSRKGRMLGKSKGLKK